MSCSSAGEPITFNRPFRPNRSIARAVASAPDTSTAALTLWPSQWPGAPSVIGVASSLPAACELFGTESYSVCIAITGPAPP